MSVTALSLANPNHVAQVASLLRSGQVIGLGLGGIYGLISSPLVGHAEKMNLVKNRPSNQPLTVLASHTHIFRWISRRQIGHPNLKTLLDTPEALSQIISQHPVHLRWKPATSRIPKHISPLLHDWGQAMQVLDLSMLGHIDNLLNHLPILAITSMNESGELIYTTQTQAITYCTQKNITLIEQPDNEHDSRYGQASYAAIDATSKKLNLLREGNFGNTFRHHIETSVGNTV